MLARTTPRSRLHSFDSARGPKMPTYHKFVSLCLNITWSRCNNDTDRIVQVGQYNSGARNFKLHYIDTGSTVLP